MSVHKDEKRGTWFFTTRLTSPSGETKQVKKRGFKTKKEATEAERLFLSTERYNKKLTLQEAFEAYKKDKEHDLKKTTVYIKNAFFYKYMLEELGDLNIHEITPLILKRWQNNLLRKHLKDSSLKEIRSKLSAIFNYCVIFYDLKENPLKKVPLVKSKQELHNKEKYTVWNIEDYEKVMNVLTSEEDRLALCLSFWTGIRKGELFALTWEDFDEKNEILTISKNKQYVTTVGFFVSTPKTNYARKIDLPKKVCERLKNYKKQNFKGNEKDFIFNYTFRFLSNIIKKGVELAHVPRIRVHDLRHSHASVLIAHNFPIAYISKRLGHSKISITLDTYTHFLEKETGEIKHKLDAF